ncbi:aminopeptidase P family protein [Peptostreptococcus equinus]|uniref:Aminopeptidase P family protein n=1 Tax=Peptostreptococcus equinus TaxID=3003601 RepID=A0ABY7JNB4_9FIRM|nr:aminopeptidase P family protein [Peptostreptococcus sp. CBA3647]WAW14859.1 aminopeptidase P family protein [Peptostreptococcus sp. CBA3647]
MKVSQRIEELRNLMNQNNIDMYIVPTADYHDSEYVGEHFKERAFITGFTGSAGTALILKDSGAKLWTDGRYFLQATQQLEGSDVDLMKMGEAGVPTLEEFIESNLEPGQTVAFDGRSISFGQGMFLEEIVKSKNGSIIYNIDLIDKIWTDRPELSKEKIFYLEESFSGESTHSKISRLREKMKKLKVDSHIITTLDDTGWLFNIRGKDVEYFPLVLSYTVVYKDKVVLYIDDEKIPEDIKTIIKNNNVEVKPYNDIYEDVKSLSMSVLVDPDRLNYAMYKNIPDSVKIVEAMNPTILMKAMKNETEISNIRKAHIKDGIAHTKFIYWMKKLVKEGKINQETEISASDKLEELRKEQGDFICPSFEPIAGFAEHGAIVHYAATEETNKRLAMNNLFLTDTGANYLQGSTDITRTTALGEISQEMKDDYTTVLQANLRLAKAIFMYGCTGMNLDILARQPFWENARNFNHGTGHGVGYLGNIHEPPSSIRWQFRKHEVHPFEEGMVITNEPGIYISGSHGVRLENEMLVHKTVNNEYGQFMRFEVLTYCPFDLEAINMSMLTEEDRKELNNYHARVYETISPYLSEDERSWLREATRSI